MRSRRMENKISETYSNNEEVSSYDDDMSYEEAKLRREREFYKRLLEMRIGI